MAGDSQFPILIGGVGGSGTRVFAEALEVAGFRTSEDLNEARDALVCTLLYKRTGLLQDLEDPKRVGRLWDLLVRSLEGGSRLSDADRNLIRQLISEPRPHHLRRWLKRRARRMRRDLKGPVRAGRWFLKEPNLHMPAPALLERRPDLRFVMVVRGGLDMAFSGNQQQRRVWGDHFLGPTDRERGPADSLRLWRAVHERIEGLRAAWPERVEVLSFDELCEQPEPVLRRLLEFAEVKVDEDLMREAMSRVHRPSTIGRHLGEDLSQLDEGDRDFATAYMNRIAIG